MARSSIQFQRGLSLAEFQRLYGTEDQCQAALEKARWPDGFRCPRCGGHEHGLVHGRRLKRYQCRSGAIRLYLQSRLELSPCVLPPILASATSS